MSSSSIGWKTTIPAWGDISSFSYRKRDGERASKPATDCSGTILQMRVSPGAIELDVFNGEPDLSHVTLRYDGSEMEEIEVPPRRLPSTHCRGRGRTSRAGSASIRLDSRRSHGTELLRHDHGPCGALRLGAQHEENPGVPSTRSRLSREARPGSFPEWATPSKATGSKPCCMSQNARWERSRGRASPGIKRTGFCSTTTGNPFSAVDETVAAPRLDQQIFNRDWTNPFDSVFILRVRLETLCLITVPCEPPCEESDVGDKNPCLCGGD